MKFATAFLFFTISFSHLVAQSPDEKRDYMWLFGYSSNPDDLNFGGSVIDFNENVPAVYYQYRAMNLGQANGSISDKGGELLFYSNGIYIANHLHQPMGNGDSINPGATAENQMQYGYILDQGILILPLSGSDHIYYMLHERTQFPEGNIGVHVSDFLYTKIDMEVNNGAGIVLEKNVEIIADTLSIGGLTATRHANGRDWWILVPEFDTNKYYRALLDPEGITVDTQIIGTPVPSGLSQVFFSPDGTKYARWNGVDHDIGMFVDIYDFDRCTGELSNQRSFNYNDFAWSGGLAFSPNSRFLYISSYNYIYQYDLHDPSENWHENADTIAFYNGFLDPFSTHFFMGQLAPDGKIYFNVSGGSKLLRVIHEPDKKGAACNFDHFGVRLPTYNNSSLPNFPNYRLGPLDGSPCDTLGIDNIPVANFRWAVDTLDSLRHNFRDLSYFEPAQWEWDFGDGSAISTDTSPVHIYEEAGLYDVCLAVSNANGSHTRCYIVEIEGDSTTSVQNVVNAYPHKLYPNPARDEITLEFPATLSGQLRFEIYDGLSRKLRQADLHAGFARHTFSLEGLASGVYFYRLLRSGSDREILTSVASVFASGRFLIQ